MSPADIALVGVGVTSFALGVSSMALWQTWRARPAKPIPQAWLPRPLVEQMTKEFADELQPKRIVGRVSEYAPMPKPPRRKDYLLDRANKLKHWPRERGQPASPSIVPKNDRGLPAIDWGRR